MSTMKKLVVALSLTFGASISVMELAVLWFGEDGEGVQALIDRKYAESVIPDRLEVLFDPAKVTYSMDDIVKSPGYGRKTAYKSIGLISPKDIDGMNQRFDNYAHIDSSKELNQDSLQTFAQRLS